MSKIKYFRNFILCGDLNYWCLLCKENCNHIVDVDKHLRWEKHRKALKSQTCMPQYTKDSIYKLESYFYCSFCNKTMKDIAEIKKHIVSEIHQHNKSHPMSGTTSRVEVKLIDEEIFINHTRVSQLQWHGIINKQCMLCNIAVIDVSGHLCCPEHVIKLIEARVNYVDDKYYRKTNNHTFQCFACEKTFSLLHFDDHFMNHSNNNSIETAKTVKGSTEFRIMKSTITDKDGKPIKDCTMGDTNSEYPVVLSAIEMEIIRKTVWDIEMLAGLKDDYFDINVENKKFSCKDCKKDIKITNHDIAIHLFAHGNYQPSLSSSYKSIQKYIDQRYIQQNFDHGADRSKTAQYGKTNFIKMNAGGSKGYCTLCDKFLSASIDVFKGHVTGSFHRGHLELKGIEKPGKHDRGVYKSIFMTELINSLAHSADKKAFLINNNTLIKEDSFFLMKRIEHGKYYKKTKCFACDETILPKDEKEHCISWKHKSNMLAAKVISVGCLPMREIRPRLYHCGVCNDSLPYWKNLQKHCNRLSHKMKHICAVPEIVGKIGFSQKIVLKTNNDNWYMQLLNAVFNTKYVINLES